MCRIKITPHKSGIYINSKCSFCSCFLRVFIGVLLFSPLLTNSHAGFPQRSSCSTHQATERQGNSRKQHREEGQSHALGGEIVCEKSRIALTQHCCCNHPVCCDTDVYFDVAMIQRVHPVMNRFCFVIFAADQSVSTRWLFRRRLWLCLRSPLKELT